jgi:hypothetical protein
LTFFFKRSETLSDDEDEKEKPEKNRNVKEDEKEKDKTIENVKVVEPSPPKAASLEVFTFLLVYFLLIYSFVANW